MASVIVYKGKQTVIHIWVFLIKLLGVEPLLFTLRHRMESLDIFEKRLFIESFYILELEESQGCHLLIDLSDDPVFFVPHIDSGKFNHFLVCGHQRIALLSLGALFGSSFFNHFI